MVPQRVVHLELNSYGKNSHRTAFDEMIVCHQSMRVFCKHVRSSVEAALCWIIDLSSLSSGILGGCAKICQLKIKGFGFDIMDDKWHHMDYSLVLVCTSIEQLVKVVENTEEHCTVLDCKSKMNWDDG
ncbi:hypothetical protein Tco_0458574 [Tanacetum coccineum]